jgi:hypothetical protein
MMESDAFFATHLLGHPALSLDLVYFVLPTHDNLLNDLGRAKVPAHSPPCISQANKSSKQIHLVL